MFYYVELPVFGQMGPNTEMDTTVHPPIVRKLHCLLDQLPKSDIWTVFPCAIVSGEFADKVRQTSCSGFEIHTPATFEAGDTFRHFHGKRARVPKLYWCHITGKAYTDDFGLAHETKLIVSVKVKELIEAGKCDGVSFIGGDSPPVEEEIDAKIWADAAKVAKALKVKNQNKPRSGWFAPPQV